VKLKVNTFRLRKNDFLEIENPFTPKLRIGGNKGSGKKWSVPSTTLRATFTSDAELSREGFNVTFTTIPFSNSCEGSDEHLDASTPGAVSTPRHPKKHAPMTYCEWVIVATDPDKKVKATFTNLSYLRKNKVYVNPTTSLYYTEGVHELTGKISEPVEIISDGQVMRIHYAGHRRSKGFKLDYEEV